MAESKTVEGFLISILKRKMEMTVLLRKSISSMREICLQGNRKENPL